MKKNYPKLSKLTKEKAKLIIENADFTDLQNIIFQELKKDYLNDKGIMIKHNIPHKKYYSNKEIVFNKISEIYPDIKKI